MEVKVELQPVWPECPLEKSNGLQHGLLTASGLRGRGRLRWVGRLEPRLPQWSFPVWVCSWYTGNLERLQEGRDPSLTGCLWWFQLSVKPPWPQDL